MWRNWKPCALLYKECKTVPVIHVTMENSNEAKMMGLGELPGW